MILEEIVLHNFGLYRGRQSISLAPTQAGKPIILFGGLNGRGKTTLLDAVHLSLYGKRAQCSNRGKMSYPDFLKKCIHQGVPAHEGASLELQFSHHQEGLKHTYRVKRSWWVTERGGLQDRLEVFFDGIHDELLTESWDERVEEFIPLGVATLFFFDGEKIEQLAEPEHAAKQLHTAIHTLLGLELLDRLDGDLVVLARRQKTALADEKSLQKIEQAKAELLTSQQTLGKLTSDLGEANNSLTAATRNLRDAEDKFRFAGGELYEQQRATEQEKSKIDSQIMAVEKQLREIAAGVSPLMLVEDLLVSVAEQAQREEELAIKDRLRQRDERILQAILEQEKDISKKWFNALKASMEKDWHVDSSSEPYLELSRKGQQQLNYLLEHEFPALREQKAHLHHELDRLREVQLVLERKLASVPVQEQIINLMQERERARGAADSYKEVKQKLELEIERTARAVDEHEAKLATLLDKQLEARHEEDAKARIVKHSERVRLTLDAFKQRVVQRHIERIELFVLESLQHLYQKKNLIQAVHIDPQSFQVSLRSVDGEEVSMERLSAGERQLLATSLLWGLARAASRPLPMIIDTPLGRLDSQHRQSLTEHYFPSASHQVLLLSTDEEINGEVLNELLPSISRQYLLQYNMKKEYTQVVEGYFKQTKE